MAYMNYQKTRIKKIHLLFKAEKKSIVEDY